jgi:hypothetical protein
VQDHLLHIAAWERSVTALVRRKPRADGLGVDAPLYFSGDIDAINEIAHRATSGMTSAEAIESCRRDHQEMTAAVGQLSDSDIGRSCREFTATKDEDDRPVYQIILDNSAGHYEEHTPWIEAIFRSGS